jgi:hypothetical protein
MQTQPSTFETSFSPFRSGLKLESTNPTADPPEGGGGTGTGTSPTPPPDPEEEEPPQ